MGSAIAVAAFVYTLLREKRDNNSDTPRTSDPFDAGVFSPALSPREEQFVRLLLKGKTPAEIARETGTKPSTVRTTLHRAYGKASVAGSRELVALFVDEGDAVVPELSRRYADDMLASARTRRLFRYLLTLFFILLAAGPCHRRYAAKQDRHSHQRIGYAPPCRDIDKRPFHSRQYRPHARASEPNRPIRSSQCSFTIQFFTRVVQ